MRIGLVSDLHWMPNPPAASAAWHGTGEFKGALERLREALRGFAQREVDAVVLAGDLAHNGDTESLVHVLTACSEASSPVLVVSGNHDVAPDMRRLDRAHELAAAGNVALATSGGVRHGDVRVAGVHVGKTDGWFGASLRELPPTHDWGDDNVVLISHYPALSLAGPVSDRGFPYPGDLLDRGELAGLLITRTAATIVLTGHVHARATLTEGPVLQLTAGALIEAPYDAAVIDIDAAPAGGLTVTRDCVRLLAHTGVREPVLSPEQEAWRFDRIRWSAADAAARVHTDAATSNDEASTQTATQSGF
ncbi:MAG: hypothetical protein V7607_5451 [Solirubrobacteraceae bacterium]